MALQSIDRGEARVARVAFLTPECAGRDELERFIHEAYARAYGADVVHFMPLLMGLYDADGAPLAALGIRTADEAPLFLEHYLDAPAERLIAERAGAELTREGLAEIGNLAVGHPGAARWLIVALNAFMGGAGFDWVTFTAVPALRNAFARMGLPLTELAAADPKCLGAEAARWGRYYDAGPVVLAGDVNLGFDHLQRAMALEHAYGLLQGVWEHALAAGRGARV